MKERSQIVKNIWWVCKFGVCFWLVFSVFLCAAFWINASPEYSASSPSHLRLVIAQFVARVFRTLFWPAKNLPIGGLVGAILVFALPFAYGVVGLVFRNCFRRIIKTKA